MALKLVTGPTIEPVSLAEAKQHLRVDHTEDDDYISGLIEGSRIFCEKYTARAFVTQSWDLILDAFPTAEIEIPLPPLQSVTSVNYFDPAGSEQTISSLNYYVDNASQPGWVVPVTAGWPTNLLVAINAVRIRFVAGYSPTTDSPPDLAANVPQSLKNAILLQVGLYYAQRESHVIGTVANEIKSGGILHLLRNYRVALGMA